MLTRVEELDRQAAFIRNRAAVDAFAMAEGTYVERYDRPNPLGGTWKALRTGVPQHWADRVKEQWLRRRA